MTLKEYIFNSSLTLSELIFEIFKKYFKGKVNSVRRVDLLYYLNNYRWISYHIPKFTDREMRQAYEDLPICGSSKGLYLPETQQEIDEQIALHIKKIRSYVRKIKVLKQYKIESDPIQKDLFYGGTNDQH